MLNSLVVKSILDKKIESGCGSDDYMTKENPTGTGSLSINRHPTANIGANSTAEGYKCSAAGNATHAEGNFTRAYGSYAHAEGNYTTANGAYAHAEGNYTTANGSSSHAGGKYTIAAYQSQTAIGEYNDNKEENIFEVGNGNSNARSNALELTKTGDLKIGGSYIDGSGNVLSMDYANEYTDQKIADLINGAPTTLDTLKEIADAMDENQDVVKALDESIGTKANASDLTEHTENTSNPHNVTAEQLGLGDVVESEVATDFSEAETPKFQQTIDGVLDDVNEIKGDLVNSDLAISTIMPNVLSATKYDGKEITSDIVNEIYNNNGGTYDLTQKLKATDKVIPRIWFDDGTYLQEISGLALILRDDNNETVEQITFGRENKTSLENATKAFLLNYNATSLTPFIGKIIKGITLEHKDFSDKYYAPKEKYSPTIVELKKSVKLLDVVIPNILMDSKYNGEQFTQNVIDKMYNSTIDIPLNEQIKGKIIPNIIFDDGTNIGNVSGYVAKIYSGNTLLEEITLGNATTQDLSTATMIKFKTYRNDTASGYIGKNILCFSATISGYTQKYKPYELESKRLQKLESELTVKNQIVCFGDSLTRGAGGNGVSYPSVLKGLVGDNYSIINQGSGGENTIAILSRQGSVATYVNNIIIPANKTAVNLCQPNEYLESNLGINSLLSIAGDMTGINPCYINGVRGILSKVNDGNGVYYTFTRSNDGEEVVINRPTRIFFNATDRYNNSILCLLIGQNGGYNTEEELVEQIRNAISHNNSGKYIILGLTTGSTTERASLEKAMQNTFGLHYLNTRKYLCMYGLSDANIEPTTQDENDIKNGIVPNSLRSDSVHLNDKGYTVLGNIVYKKGVELGYW